MRSIKILSALLIPPILLLLLLTATLVPIFGVAHASTSIPASGTVEVGAVLEGPEYSFAGGNVFWTQTQAVKLHGTLETNDINVQRYTLHPNGLINLQEWVTADGTVEGVGTGTLYMVVAGQITPSGDISGIATIISGTGDLENLHGTFKLGGSLSTSITYSGQIHVNP